MRRTIIWIAGTCALAVAGCGGSGSFANDPRPPTPVNLTVYIGNARVSLSPQSVGAGPVVFIVTNQADTSESLAIVHKGRTSTANALADTGPINPQATAQVMVNFRPGDYTISTSTAAGTQAQQAAAKPVRGASLHIGPPRASASNQLLQP
jgi:hypothetical protein